MVWVIGRGSAVELYLKPRKVFMARTSKYSEAIIKEMCTLIEEGLPNKDAAALIGICESTLYKWLSNDLDNPLLEMQKTEFLESMGAAKARRHHKLASIIIKASETNWRAAAWYLERTEPEDYGLHSCERNKGFLPREEEEKAEVSPLLIEAYNQTVRMLATGEMPHFNAFRLCLNDEVSISSETRALIISVA